MTIQQNTNGKNDQIYTIQCNDKVYMHNFKKYTVFSAGNLADIRLTVSFESLGNIVGMSILIGSK